jgi:hypothetical protein
LEREQAVPEIQAACIKCEIYSPNMRGALCSGCAGDLACADYHVPETVRSAVARERVSGWLIDPWGQPHAIASRSTLGRSAGNDIVISDRHVSSEHAELRATDDGWRVRDRGSTAGTHVGVQRNIHIASIAHLDELHIASIGFYLWARTEPPAAAAPVVTTIAGAPDGFRIIGPGGQTLTLRAKPARDPRKGHGSLFIAAAGAVTQQPLSTLQFQLLRLLCGRALAAEGHGAYVDTSELLRALPFPALQPQDVNVRQVVRSVRRLLEKAEIGLGKHRRTEVIETVNRMGYRIAWRVEYAAPDDT